jgi:phospholipase C
LASIDEPARCVRSRQKLTPPRRHLLDGECVNDPDHAWIAMYQSWNGGANDGWLPAKVSNTPLQGNVPVPMGYYTRKDLPIHYLLADTFTICDQYHCSPLGGTTPNGLYWMSAWIDPDGTHGGPVRVEPNIQPLQHYSWRIMPENLDDAGVSWTVHQDKVLGALNNTVMGYNGLVNDFKQAGDPSSSEAG